MPIKYLFRSLGDVKEVDDLPVFMRSHNWGYKGYGDWVERTRAQLLLGNKNVIQGFYEGNLIASLIYQPHRQFPRVRELKNLRVAVPGRGIASFLLKLALTEDTKSFDAVVCDVPEEKKLMQGILKSIGFEELARAPIYEDGRNHVILVKSFERTPGGIFSPIKKSLISRVA